MNSSNDPLNESIPQQAFAGASTSGMSVTTRRGVPVRAYESFSKGIDALNRYLLNRIENEPTVDELVKERIIKVKQKSTQKILKYFLIFGFIFK